MVSAIGITEAVFEPIVTSLLTVRDSSDRLTGAVAAFSEAATNKADGQTGATQEAGLALFDAVERIGEQIANMMQRNDMQDFNGISRKLKNDSRELTALASFTLIVAAHIDPRIFDGKAFVNTIKDLGQRLQRAEVQIENTLTRAQELGSQAQTRLATIQADLRNFLQIDRVTPDIMEAADTQVAVEVAAKLQQDMGMQMRVVVACMQHPDAFRQRGEHVQAILDMAHSARPQVAQVLTALAGAQCADMARELEDVGQGALQTLDAMKRDGQGAARDLHRSIAADDHLAQLDQKREAITDTLSQIARTRREAQEAIATLARLQTLFEASRATMTELRDDRETVRLSAFNAGLVSQKLGSESAGMGALATSIRDTSFQCGETINAMTALLAEVLGQAEQIDSAVLEQAFDAVSAAMEADQALLKRFAQKADALHRAAHDCETLVQDLTGSAAAAAERLAELPRAIEETRALAARLTSDASTDAAPDFSDSGVAQALAEVLGLYTMDSERIVHQSQTGQTVAAPALDSPDAAPPSDAEPDLEDIFF